MAATCVRHIPFLIQLRYADALRTNSPLSLISSRAVRTFEDDDMLVMMISRLFLGSGEKKATEDDGNAVNSGKYKDTRRDNESTRIAGHSGVFL